MIIYNKINNEKYKENIFEHYNWIDFTKGIAIFLVVFGHALHEYFTVFLFPFHIIYSFHMPLFFIISGYLFNPSKCVNVKQFIKNKIRKLLFPYLIFCFLIYVSHIIQYVIFDSNIQYLIDSMKIESMLNTILMTNKSIFANLWFLPSLFATEIIFAIILKRFRSLESLVIIAIIMIIMVFLYGNFINISLPLDLEASCLATVFMIVGFIYKSKDKDREIKKYVIAIELLLFIIFNGISYYTLNDKPASFYSIEITTPWVFMITSITGSFFLMNIAKIIQSQRYINSFGRISLYIYGIHFLIQNIFGLFIKLINVNNRIIQFIIIIFCTILNMMIIKWGQLLLLSVKKRWLKK